MAQNESQFIAGSASARRKDREGRVEKGEGGKEAPALRWVSPYSLKERGHLSKKLN